MAKSTGTSTRRFVGLFLALTLTVPSPALALRPEAKRQQTTGLEELERALQDSDNPAQAVANVVGRRLAATLGIPAAQPAPVPAAGLEEGGQNPTFEVPNVEARFLPQEIVDNILLKLLRSPWPHGDWETSGIEHVDLVMNNTASKQSVPLTFAADKLKQNSGNAMKNVSEAMRDVGIDPTEGRHWLLRAGGHRPADSSVLNVEVYLSPAAGLEETGGVEARLDALPRAIAGLVQNLRAEHPETPSFTLFFVGPAGENFLQLMMQGALPDTWPQQIEEILEKVGVTKAVAGFWKMKMSDSMSIAIAESEEAIRNTPTGFGFSIEFEPIPPAAPKGNVAVDNESVGRALSYIRQRWPDYSEIADAAARVIRGGVSLDEAVNQIVRENGEPWRTPSRGIIVVALMGAKYGFYALGLTAMEVAISGVATEDQQYIDWLTADNDERTVTQAKAILDETKRLMGFAGGLEEGGITLEGIRIPRAGTAMNWYSDGRQLPSEGLMEILDSETDRLVVPLADVAPGTVVNVQERFDAGTQQWRPVMSPRVVAALEVAAVAGGIQVRRFQAEEVPAIVPHWENVYVIDVEIGHEREFVDAAGIVINVRGGQGPESPEELGGLIHAAREADNQILRAGWLYRSTDPEIRSKVFALDTQL